LNISIEIEDAPIRLTSVTSSGKPRGLLMLFVLAVFLPIALEIAQIRLTPTRIFLLIAIIPLAVQCIAGKFGRFTIVDALVLCHGLWIFVSLVAVHGLSRIPFAGITMVELVGGYFVGRALVRDVEGYRTLLKIIFAALLTFLPFAIYENFSGKLVIPDLFRPFFDTPTRDLSARGRIGLERVQGPFEHPILWGMFCSMMFANFFMAFKIPLMSRFVVMSLTIWLTFMALSSGPLLSLLLQATLMLWGWLLKGRWLTLVGLVLAGYLLLDLASNRTPLRILLSVATFNKLSAFTRLAQFDAGVAAVMNSPLFGIGFNSWPKPHWVNDSIDNFWLLTAMRYGVLGFLSLMVAFVMHFFYTIRAAVDCDMERRARLGYLFVLLSVSLVLATVHIWGNVSVFVMFYLGVGAFFYTSKGSPVPQSVVASESGARHAGTSYSRFLPNHNRSPHVASSAGDSVPRGKSPDGLGKRMLRGGEVQRQKLVQKDQSLVYKRRQKPKTDK
jgi:hypothetical protein